MSQVGRYLLLKRLGEGGMGVVYAAYDPDLERKVALKLLRPDIQTDSEEARARLLREAQAMARVSHPNVIPIFDVGVWGDQVFLAMELVDGGTLSAWLQQEGGHPWREVLEKFLAAGQGLQAAHEAGLVHRDFKPANVLLSRNGRVYVTDFGLARQVGAPRREEPLPEQARQLSADRRMLETTITEVGMVMGTPAYMSPEQMMDSELDARSDQFSFCAALYWGLYRQRAFDPDRLHSHLASQPPPKPITPEGTQPLTPPGSHSKKLPKAEVLIQEPPRDVKVPAWVKQAVLRGLALESGARFPSMKELLQALSQEQRRAQRRLWAGVAVATVAGLSVMAGGVYHQSQACAGAGAPMEQIWSPAARQKLEAAFAATDRPFAAETASRVVQVLEGYATEWKRQNTAVCEASRKRGTQPEELLARRVVCLERRRKNMRATVDLLSGADGALVEKALDAAHALPQLQECEDVEALADQQGRPTDPAKRAEIDRLEERLAEVRARVDAGRYPAAQEEARQLEAPVLATGYLPLMSELRFHLGWIQEQLGHSPEAAQLLSQAIFDAEAGREDRLKVAILNKLLFVEDGQKHFGQATGWGQLAEATIRRLGGDPLLEADVRVNQANLAMSQSAFAEARTLLEQARALQARALAPGHPKRARTTFLLGRVLNEMGETSQAVVMLEEALKQTEASVGALHPDMARRHGTLSWALRQQKDYARALEHARAAADIAKATLGPKSFPFAVAQDEVGMCLLGLGRYEEALKLYEETLAARKQTLPADSELLQYSYDGVGQALLGLGRVPEGIEALRNALSITSAPDSYLAQTGFTLAQALWRSGQSTQARSEATRARERFSQAGQPARVTEVDTWLKSVAAARP
ncbi:Serine/threonine kinase family protein [Hyalangium minutum]|uniref:Serine/threonine kinase family protein n=2 Tax=Hyalangium minutum TaxID=394096 RepID=A0A085WAK6_9BACT|nr:Serine/threonine kinase family protein [Hyalangium minutum]